MLILRLKRLEIRNFRNFETIDIGMSNQNVVFGMNDVGKTNLLFALRFLLDREVRKNGFVKSDFHLSDTSRKIEILLEVDISDYESGDTKKVISKVKGARTSENLDTFYFKLEGEFEEKELFGHPLLFWGNDLSNLQEVPQRGDFTDLDRVFKVVYVDPTIDLDETFKRNKKNLFDETNKSSGDLKIGESIETNIKELNDNISSLEMIKEVQTSLTSNYKLLKDENLAIELKSELVVNGFLNNLVPYIKKDGDENYYPTSGDGRKKLLAYSLLNHLTLQQFQDKVVIYLIEEPENSLHRSMQIALSKQLFCNKVYDYFVLSTHSPQLLYEMDNTELIRISSKGIIEGFSYLYNVGNQYSKVKKKLNKSLAEALFSERVLLIEGPSEQALFERVLSDVRPNYELDGGFLLMVNGIAFKKYIEVLSTLGINCYVKTDNDLKAKKKSSMHDLIGLNRCLDIVGEKFEPPIEIIFEEKITKNEKKQKLNEKKKEINDQYTDLIKLLKDKGIYLSSIDLEHDLYKVLGKRMEEILDTTDPVNYLQNKKLYNMVEFIESMDEQDSKDVYSHPLFSCLRKVCGDNI